MQVASQNTQHLIPPSAFGIDSPSTSRHQYSPQIPQATDPNRIPLPTRSTHSPSSSRHPSKSPSGDTFPRDNPERSQQHQDFPSPNAYSSNPGNQQVQAMLSTTRASPIASLASNPSVLQQSRPGQRAQLESAGGPPFSPPPRTSSNQRGHSSNISSNAPPPDRKAGSRSGALDDTSRRNANTRNAWQSGSGDPSLIADDFSGGEDRDVAAAAVAVTQSKRRDPTSPERPQRANSTRESTRQHSSPVAQSRSASQFGPVILPGRGPKEESGIINRLVVTDPEIDLKREQERQAEALPILESAGSGGADDGTRGAPRSRQDHLANASRRKETRFGEYVLGQTLGEGEFGKVKLGWKKDGSVQVAIKLIRRENLESNPSRLPKIYREISILRELSHPNIVRLHEMAETERYIGIILEYASGGELFDFILNHRYLKDNAARRLFAQLVSGVGYLHKKGIVHRDLKLENLLLDRNRNIIITDFGFANTFNPRDELGDEIEYNLTNRDFVKRLDLERVHENGSRRGDLMQTSCGSPCYAAPELVVTDSLYTGRKVDVWSCGVILYAMLAGYLPFDDDPANPEGDNINLLYKYIVSTPLTFPEYVTPHARDLLRRILVPDPRKRADLFEVARHSWLSDYAHVVSHVTSSTTTVGEIKHTTVASDHQDAPLLARSASVREPVKVHPQNASPVGGLAHQGKIDPDQPVEKSKQSRDPKRRTVQVEYVAPQSETVRGEATPSMQSPVAVDTPSGLGGGPSKNRFKAGNEPLADATIQAGAINKPLPQDPDYIQTSSSNRYQYQPVDTKIPSASASLQQTMQPPARPPKEMPRSASDSHGAFGNTNLSTTTRPNTSGSMASNGAGRLPSRGNSYSQPLAPTVAPTNAQGRLAQPKNGKQYNISAPIPQSGSYFVEQSIGRPSTQQANPALLPESQRDQTRGHKRSNTFGNVFSRSGSIFGGRSQPQSPQEQSRHQPEKRYPPTSMKSPLASDSPRQSVESRRSASFGFGRKTSDLRKSGEVSKSEKSRRFSLLPASFSLKILTGTSRDLPADAASAPYEQRPSTMAQSAPSSRGQSRQQNTAGNRGQSRNNSSRNEETIPAAFDGQRERSRGNTSQQTSPPDASYPIRPLTHTSAPGGSSYSAQPGYGPSRPIRPGQSYLLGESGSPSNSDHSLSGAPHRPLYPAGFDSHDGDDRTSSQQRRSGRVLQRNHRKLADAYEHEQEPGSGTGGHHAGSSGAAKRVMDFFRRRGKARAGDD